MRGHGWRLAWRTHTHHAAPLGDEATWDLPGVREGPQLGPSKSAGLGVAEEDYVDRRVVVTRAVDTEGELKVRSIEGILALCESLNGNEVMQELNLAGTGLEPCSAKVLARILPTMT